MLSFSVDKNESYNAAYCLIETESRYMYMDQLQQNSIISILHSQMLLHTDTFITKITKLLF